MLIKKLFKNYWILIFILLVAGILRLWKLGSIPPGLTQDEAALGYNAYSIIKTGRDEYGKFLPVIFKSFGDYKPGLYVYLDVPFVAVLGLNEVSTRLPSALAGVLSVYLLYLICNKLFVKKFGSWNLEFGICAAFVAAVNPWLIFFSRGAWEANVSLTLTLAGIYFFLKSRHTTYYILHSIFFFALTLLTYQGAKLSTAIVVVILTIIYWKEIFRFNKKFLFGGIGLGIIISAPIVISLFTGQIGRLDVFSIFSYPRPTDYIQTFLNEGSEKIGSFDYFLFHSETLNFARGILGRYFNHFSAKFLFFEGDYQNPQHSAPYQGMLLLGDILLLPLGLIALARSKTLNRKSVVFVFLWLIFSPLPAVLSRDQVQSVRALNMSVPLIIIASFGLVELAGFLNRKLNGKLMALVVLILYILPFNYFADAYYIHVPAHNSQYWNYGYKKVVEEITPIEKDYKNIIVEQSFAQPYIYFLYYQKYDPTNYQKQAVLVQGPNVSDVGVVGNLDNLTFSTIDWSQIRSQHGTLVVVDGITTIPADLSYTTIKKINYLNGRDLAFDIIRIK